MLHHCRVLIYAYKAAKSSVFFSVHLINLSTYFAMHLFLPHPPHSVLSSAMLSLPTSLKVIASLSVSL